MRKLILQILYSLLLLWFSLTASNAQQVFKTTSASVIGYLEHVPQDYNANSDKYPVVIFLHGIGERGANSTDPAVINGTIQAVAKIGPPMYVKNGTQFPFILISPQLKNNYGTWPSSYVMEVINHVKTYLRIDERRIYLTGLSLGGGGVWVAAQDYPELFAAIAPVCGGYNSPSKACGIASENLPVWAFHGDKDATVHMSKTVNMVNAINACTPKPSPLAKLTIYPGVGHSAWTNAYKTDNSIHDPNVYEWIQSFINTTNKGNKIPVTNAGSDKSISLVSSTTLTGSATDTDGTIASYAWTQLSGPTTATLTNGTTKTLTVAGMAVGTYSFRFKTTDNSGNTDSDYVTLTVTPANVLPVANAGTDKTITLPQNSVTVTGSGTDADGTIASYAWTKVSGSTVILSGTTTTTLTASGLVEGSYVFRLTVKDNRGGSKYDDMKVTVVAGTSAPFNQAPVVNAGADISITLPISAPATITGSASDPDGSISYHRWYKISGPYVYYTGVMTYTLNLSKLYAGTYKFKLVVRDNLGLETYDEVTITVQNTTTTASATSARIQPVSDMEMPSASEPIDSYEPYAGLGKVTSSQLENATVVIFNGDGEKIFTGVWGENSYREVLNKQGLYLYSVIKDGTRTETGKIYIRN
jgi:dienelactone hydrolase